MQILHTKNLIRAVFVVCGLALHSMIPAARAFAQSSTSAVNGVVTDANKGVIVGAKVTLTNVDTNVARTTVTNSTGDYFFSSVVPARYTLSFVEQGFQTETISQFAVGVAQAVTLNAILRVGAVSETVTVQASSVELESSTSQLGTVIGEQQVSSLPLDGRNFTQLLTLTPGVTPVSTGQNGSASNTDVVKGSNYSFPSINGAGNRSTIYLTDGLNNNQAWYNTYATPPIIDQVAEFKVNSHNDAVYGGSLGGTVNIITKAGTNAYHGTAWEYVRTNSFDANPFFKAVAEVSYHLNTFGGQMGGPIQIPKLYNGRNKTFFEIGMEGTHYSQSGSTNILEPTAAQLGETTYGGPQTLPFLDFSSAQTGAKGGCTPGATTVNTGACQLYNPTVANNASAPNRPAYLGNQIPVAEANANALAFIKTIFTQAPIVIPGIATTTANQQITAPTRQQTYNYTGRIDQHIGSKDFIFFRYAGFENTTIGPSTLPTLFSTTLIPSQQYGVSWLHVFSPTTSMQLQYGRTHVEQDAVTQFSNHDLWKTYGCSADMCDAFVGGASLLVTQAVTGGFSGGEANSPSANLSSIHEWSGSVSRTIGNHVLQAGGGWDEVNYTAELRQGSVGFTGASTANFTGNPSSPSGVSATSQPGSGLADFILDYPNNENKRNVLLTERPGGIGSAYVQDSWKMTRDLTVNFGVRYDRSAIPAFGTEASVGLQGSIETGDFDFNNGTYIIQQLPPLCSVRMHAPCMPSAILPANVVVATGGKILHGTKDNIGPRVGFALRVNDGMSVRGGFGITYDNWAAIIQMTQNYQGSWPDTGTLQINGTNLPGTPYTSAQNPFAQNGGNLPSATPFSSSNVNYMVDPLWKNPYSEQYNFGIEQQLARRTLLVLNYVGSASHRLDVGGYYNTGTPAAGASFATRQAAGTTGQPYPYTVPEKSWDHHGASASYNALQAMYRGNFPGLTFMASYTWSKTLDEGGDGYFGVEGGVPEDPYNPKGSRGPASFSIPQLFTANFTYELPIGVGKRFSTGSRVANLAIGNWQVQSILTGRSGQNFNVTSAGDIANTGNASTYERANLLANPWVAGPVSSNPSCTLFSGSTRTAQQWFNPCAYQTPASGTLGNAGRNILQDQTYWNLDASIFRIFPITERVGLKADLEAFNSLNHPVLGTPGTATTTSATLGVITSTASTARILQGSIRFQF
ncbi:MAG TPA: TonB-dependent receptor [Acidobacteriaceae bacterium]